MVVLKCMYNSEAYAMVVGGKVSYARTIKWSDSYRKLDSRSLKGCIQKTGGKLEVGRKEAVVRGCCISGHSWANNCICDIWGVKLVKLRSEGFFGKE